MSATFNDVNTTDSIPASFTPSVDRPFDPIGVRWLYDQSFRRDTDRLTDEQIREMQGTPQELGDGGESRLREMTEEANKKLEKEFEEVKIYNMSIKDVAHRTSDVVQDVLDDMLNYDPEDGYDGFLHIFTRQDRLVYIGVIVVIFAVLLALIKSSD